jgi:hypothetical protein
VLINYKLPALRIFALPSRLTRVYLKLSVRTKTMLSSTFPPEELKAIVQEVATLLKERNETISVAETAGPSLDELV